MVAEPRPVVVPVVRPARFDRPYRHLTTRELLAAQEVAAWDRAHLAAHPADWAFPAESAAFVDLVAAEVGAELARRERLRRRPLAPAWPDDRGDVE